jgi:hypothetical protein
MMKLEEECCLCHMDRIDGHDLRAVDGKTVCSRCRPVPAVEAAMSDATFPTEAQVRSACLSFRHDFGLLGTTVQANVMWQAREWLRAWQKEPGLHTAALAARDERIAALEAGLRPFAVAFQAALIEVPDRPISLAAFGALAKLHVDAAHFQAARALLDGGKA